MCSLPFSDDFTTFLISVWSEWLIFAYFYAIWEFLLRNSVLKEK